MTFVAERDSIAMDGRDPQLERAIEEVLAELKKNPPHEVKQPPFPVRVLGDAREGEPGLSSWTRSARLQPQAGE